MKKLGLYIFAVMLLLVATGAARAQSNQFIYADSLTNGWQDYSWSARDLAATEFVHTGANSAKVTYTAGFQGFYLHHAALDTAPFTHLEFWIHGGATNGRNIRLQIHLNEVAQPGQSLNGFIEGGAVAAGQWRRVSIPLADAGAANQPNLTGFWLQDGSGGAQPAFYVDDIRLIAAPPPSSLQINVNAANVRRAVDARAFGINSAVWDNDFNTPATVSLLNANQTKFLRFPGGSLSDAYHWQTNRTDDSEYEWPTSFTAFANVAVATNAQVIITANYGSGSPLEAALWVDEVARSYNHRFKYWEIGNENYGSWENDTHPRPHDPFTYATQTRDYIAQMKDVDPTIKVGVVVEIGEDSYANYTDHPAVNPRTGQTHNGWTPVMLATLRALNVRPDFVIYHKYPQNGGQEGDDGLLQASASWTNDAANLRQQLTDYLGAANAAGVEIVGTEANSVSFNPGKQTTSLVNGLFLADTVGQVLQTEVNGLLWWDLRNGRETANNNNSLLYGWRLYGDYGMIGPNNDLYPTYYVSRLLTQFARGGEQVVTATSNYGLLAAYAVRNPTANTLSLLVINKSPTASLNANLALAGFAPQGNGTAYSYGIPQDEAARTGLGSRDVATTPFTGAGPNFAYTFAPYSATVLVLPEAPAAPVVQLSATSYQASEGAPAAALTVIRAGNAALPLSVDYQTNDNPALVGCNVANGQASQRCDYLTASGSLNFAAGETTKTFSVLLVDDLYVEGNETVTLSLSNPTGGASLGANATATLTIADNDAAIPTANPLETAQFFVRQHYVDFLAREPDASGVTYWTQQLTQCGADAACLRARRVAVSNAFFFEQEFQKTGSYIYRLYKAAYGDANANYRPAYAQFMPDRARLNADAALLAQSLQDQANLFVARPAFVAKYPAGLTGPQFVDALLATINTGSGVSLQSQRDTLITEYNAGGRGRVLYRLADDNAAANPVNNRAFIDAEYNRAFVLTEYFGYLRRDPDQGGYDFWLSVVNQFPLRDARGQSGMVCAFITSQEYQERFSAISPRGNAECQ